MDGDLAVEKHSPMHSYPSPVTHAAAVRTQASGAKLLTPPQTEGPPGWPLKIKITVTIPKQRRAERSSILHIDTKMEKKMPALCLLAETAAKRCVPKLMEI